jgi:DNA polymerase III subunit delta'
MTPGAWPVYGHTWASQLLQRALLPEADTKQSVRLSHAYLFLGSPQVGKTAFARAFATALLCSACDHTPCYECRSCRLMALDSHPDFRLLQPTAKADKEFVVDRQKGELRAEHAENLIRDVALRPMEGTRKVFVIQDMHLANLAFANKILKTLEEPPPHAVLLVTARHRAELLPTIVSRCQVIELRPLDQPVIVDALQRGWQATAQEAELLARLSGGRLGWAVDQLRHPERREERTHQLESLWRLIAADRLERLRFAGELAAQRDNQRLFGLLEVWTSWWRDVLLTQSACDDACSHVDQQERIAHHAQAIEQRVVHEYLLTLKRIETYLRHTVNVRLALDVLLLKLPAIDRHA